jgi:von Willebrand factor type A domain
VVRTCIGALAVALRMETVAPDLAACFKGHPNETAITDLLRGCAGQDGTLLPEAFRLLALLALDPRIAPPPPSPASGTGPAGAPGPGQQAPGAGQGSDPGGGGEPGSDPGAASPEPAKTKRGRKTAASAGDPYAGAKPLLDAFDKRTDTLTRDRKLRGALRDGDFRRELQAAGNRVFHGPQNLREPDGATMIHTSPGTFGGAITPFSKAELIKARSEFIGDAIRAFVEATAETIGDDEYRYRIAQDRLPAVVAEPLAILVGDTMKRLPNCTVDLVLDVSGSMQGGMSARDASGTTRMAALLHAVKLWIDGAEACGASGVKVGIRLFASATARHMDFTDLSGVDTRALTGDAIERTSARGNCGGGTCAWAGLQASIRDLEGETARKRAILLITDGAILQEDFETIAREWPEGIALVTLALSDDAAGMFGTDNDLFKFRALTADEVAPMLAMALRESVESQGARG